MHCAYVFPTMSPQTGDPCVDKIPECDTERLKKRQHGSVTIDGIHDLKTALVVWFCLCLVRAMFLDVSWHICEHIPKSVTGPAFLRQDQDPFFLSLHDSRVTEMISSIIYT